MACSNSRRKERKEEDAAMDTAENEDNSDEEQGGEDDDRTGHDGDLNVTKNRQHLRHEYRKLMHNLQEKREQLIQPDNESLTAALQQGQKLFLKVKATREAAMDSQFLVLAATIGHEKAAMMQAGLLDFDEGVFTEHVLTYMGCCRRDGEGARATPRRGTAGDDDAYVTDDGTRFPPGAWARLAACASSYMSVVPTFHYMLGTFKADPLPVVRAEKKKTRPVISRQEMRAMPEQVKKLQLGTEEGTEKNVKRIQGILKEKIKANGGRPLIYVQFVINPTSYFETLENMFHTTFLLRDKVVWIRKNEDGVHIIGLMREGEGGNAENNAESITMDMATWKELIDVCRIKSPMIPPVPSHSTD